MGGPCGQDQYIGTAVVLPWDRGRTSFQLARGRCSLRQGGLRGAFPTCGHTTGGARGMGWVPPPSSWSSGGASSGSPPPAWSTPTRDMGKAVPARAGEVHSGLLAALRVLSLGVTAPLCPPGVTRSPPGQHPVVGAGGGPTCAPQPAKRRPVCCAPFPPCPRV